MMKLSRWERAWKFPISIVPLITVLIALATVFVSLNAAHLSYSASEDNTGAQLVALAINILREGQRSESDKALRGWAADLLKAYSEKVAPPDEVLNGLRSGNLKLPAIAGCGAVTDRPDIVKGVGKVGGG
jgi:hypothetical protein